MNSSNPLTTRASFSDVLTRLSPDRLQRNSLNILFATKAARPVTSDNCVESCFLD